MTTILTLTTDWGRVDHYLGAFKGKLLSKNAAIQIVDITHDIEHFNIMQAAFIVRNAYRQFPKGTIHFIGVTGNDNPVSTNTYVIVKAQGQFFFGEDNGIFSLMLGEEDREIIRLPFSYYNGRGPITDELVETINSIATGDDLYRIGLRDTNLQESYFAQPTVESDTIRGSVIYIDSFENVVVNIKCEFFEQELRERKFVIHLRKSEYTIRKLSNTYEDVEVGEIVALFNSDGYLEIALNRSPAASLLGLKLLDIIRIEFL
jgi:S-adenosyl-L-methionine hydrolase (adenosine-forming)